MRRPCESMLIQKNNLPYVLVGKVLELLRVV